MTASDNNSMQERFRATISAACERPQMYVGRKSLRDLAHYLEDYCHASQDSGVPIAFGVRFQRWIEGRFRIFGSGWHWVRILQHEYENDGDAISSLPELYDEFLATTRNMGDEELKNWMERRLKSERTESKPVTTETRTSWQSLSCIMNEHLQIVHPNSRCSLR